MKVLAYVFVVLLVVLPLLLKVVEVFTKFTHQFAQ